MKKGLLKKSINYNSVLFITLVGMGSAVFAGEIKVSGDSPCPSGYSLISPEEARESKSELCSKLGSWDIVRLADGGSMDGSGYGCKVRDSDTRKMGSAFCKKPESFSVKGGDASCSGKYKSVSPLMARRSNSSACAQLGDWSIARLSGGGAIDGSGYGCGVRNDDARSLGQTLCATYTYKKVSGDTPCPSGYSLTDPQEARSKKDYICSKLGQWDILRLAGGGSMDGPGYGCKIRDYDSRSLKGSVCSISK